MLESTELEEVDCDEVAVDRWLAKVEDDVLPLDVSVTVT